MKINYTVVGLCIVLAPVLILALHLYNTKKENFAASQGGAQIQLIAGHVASEQEIAEMVKYQKRQVVKDLLNLTEPERYPGPYPSNQLGGK